LTETRCWIRAYCLLTAGWATADQVSFVALGTQVHEVDMISMRCHHQHLGSHTGRIWPVETAAGMTSESGLSKRFDEFEY